jgi:crotonobetainyl-CoA:carnitine CoA-transferase CaiB-like acyl-CoA transferase
MSGGLLAGVTVLSLEQATTLPFLTYRLACDGARVIRVENAERPDPNRFVGRDLLPEPAMRSYFLPNNCGKEAITLNLGHPEGRALLRELIVKLRVDVFACNQRPRSYARLGIEPRALCAVKPDLIWLGITGFGPEHDEAAYDPVLQARSGFMELTGETDGAPLVFGLPMVDLGAAEHGYSEVMKALYRRATTGEGACIDVSMLRSAVSWMVAPVALSSLGERVTRKGNRHQFFAPVAVHRTRDGHVYLAIGNDQQCPARVCGQRRADCRRRAARPRAGRVLRRSDQRRGARLAERRGRSGLPREHADRHDGRSARRRATPRGHRSPLRAPDRAAGPAGRRAAGAQLSAPTRRAQ